MCKSNSFSWINQMIGCFFIRASYFAFGIEKYLTFENEKLFLFTRLIDILQYLCSRILKTTL